MKTGRHGHLWGVILLFLVLPLAACQQAHKGETRPLSIQSGVPASLPAIVSAQTRDGRGIPNGRSDSDEPYLRLQMPVATAPDFGLTEHNPVKVGPFDETMPHLLYLNSLRGPNGEPLDYERLGACCPFDIDNELQGGLLDIYRLRVDGRIGETYLFVDMYRSAPLQLPAGFTQRE
ncbi:hypothetical protein [Dokdonella sp.]|uniref:hypothetical protein n=1 Tax=Dokdonella sp. TaxID=2291710 RepID=UPI0035278E41